MPGGIHPPIVEILRWPTPNYTNPTTRPNTVSLVAYTCGPITFLMLLVRLWVRLIHLRNAGWDDWLMIMGTVCTLVITAIFPLAIQSGFNRHIWDINILEDPGQTILSRKYVLAIFCIFCIASGLIKISILLFFRRLSSRVVSKCFRWTTWITIGFIALSTIAFSVSPLVGCHPISAFWDQLDYSKLAKGYKFHCSDEGAEVFVASVVSAVQDLITALLPTFLYWNLRIPVRQKIALFGIFAIGYGVAALGILRAYYSWKIYYMTYDVTWASWDLFMVSLLELHVGCFCANAPTSKAFITYFLQEKLGLSTKPLDASGKRGRKHGELSRTQSSKSSAGMIKDKVSVFFLKVSSATRDGYLSEPHMNTSVDRHCGVELQRNAFVLSAPSPITIVEPAHRNLRESVDTMDMICAQYYDDDIELGRFTTARNSKASSFSRALDDVEELPPMPQTPGSLRSMRSFIPYNRQSKQSRASFYAEWPNRPLPAVIAGKKSTDQPQRHLYPPRNASLQRPDWRGGN